MHRLSYLLIALVLLLGCNSPFIKMDATPTAKVAPLTLSSGSAGNITPNFRPTMGSLQTPSALPASGECLGEQVFKESIYRLQSPREIFGLPSFGDYYSGVILADFAVEATIETPNTPVYEYGFTFRKIPNEYPLSGYRPYSLWISERKELSLWYGEDTQVIPLPPYPIFTQPGAKNTLRMAAVGGQGWVSVNGTVVGSLDLSAHVNAGDIGLRFGTYPKDVHGDGFTSATLTLWNVNRNGTGCTSVDGWTDFLTAPIPPQERLNRCLSTLVFSAASSDTLPSDEKNYLVRAALEYPPLRDFVLQANLYNLNVLRYQYGFSFRYLDNNADEWEEYRLWIKSDRTWQLERYPGSEGETPVQTGSLPPEVDLGGAKEVRLIAVGEQGWFFINNILISALDLSDIDVSGGIALIRQAEQVITAPQIAGYIGLWNVNLSASNCDSLDTWLAEFEK